MNIIEKPLPERQKQQVFRKAIKVKGYLELCKKNLIDSDDKISYQSVEHRVIRNILEDIHSAESSINILIARTNHDTHTD